MNIILVLHFYDSCIIILCSRYNDCRFGPARGYRHVSNKNHYSSIQSILWPFHVDLRCLQAIYMYIILTCCIHNYSYPSLLFVKKIFIILEYCGKVLSMKMILFIAFSLLISFVLNLNCRYVKKKKSSHEARK